MTWIDPFEKYLGTTQRLVETGRLRKGWRPYSRKIYPHVAWFLDGTQRVGITLSDEDCEAIEEAGYDLRMEGDLSTPIPVRFMDNFQSSASCGCLRIAAVIREDTGEEALPDLAQVVLF